MEYTPLQHTQAVLWIHLHNMKELHWTVCANNFYSNHLYLDEIADHISKDIDVIAEMGMSFNQAPLSLANIIQDIAQDKAPHPNVDPTVRRDGKATFTLVMQILDDIKRTYDTLYDIDLPRCYTSHIESMQEYYFLQMKYLVPSKFIGTNSSEPVPINQV